LPIEVERRIGAKPVSSSRTTALATSATVREHREQPITAIVCRMA
jgi:hypothetical protein